MSEDKNWKERIKEVGKEAFEIEDMIRLGFLQMDKETMAEILDKQKAYNKLSNRFFKINRELDSDIDITPYIKIIREKRIKESREKRALRKIEKAKKEAERKQKIAEKQEKMPSYLGDEISAGLKYEGTNEERLTSTSLPVISDLKELEVKSNITAKHWQWLAFYKKVSNIDHYNRFTIPKKNGDVRKISAPKKRLRVAQEWIQNEILSKIELHEKAYAYRKNISIVDNAKLHQNAKVVVRIDLKDFFPSIKFNRVKGLFKSFGYSEALATIFASVCTDSVMVKAQMSEKVYHVSMGNKFLPQGACTSPALTNIICKKMDKRIENFTKKNGIRYTRYADDLVFSTEDENINLKSFFSWIHRIIKEEGFQINNEKTRVMRPNQRQAVTGIIINEGGDIRISRKDIRKFRAFIHNFKLKGEEEARKQIGKNPNHYLEGYLSFIRMVNKDQFEKMKAYAESKLEMEII
ncbi:retron St85 family RNA-directed DNA polymerase [Aureivirga marina]|uniref:retron St85 family RNA-directed DNA polymerase n=1 Tax=Aureivirga marina TaxID=1182451 RepID=UPI0018CB44EB|nr:retron St85 family RNA-directed DNA polymerase [Aureivirga marina]